MSGLEFAARYTHRWADGRTETVTLIHHETPGDREWAVARVAEMTRAQEAFDRPVDAHLLVRRAATEWQAEELTEQQRNGWACVGCGTEDTESTAMAPAGFVDGRQLFRCAAGCGPKLVEPDPLAFTLPPLTEELYAELCEVYNTDSELTGIAAVYQHMQNVLVASFVSARRLAGAR